MTLPEDALKYGKIIIDENFKECEYRGEYRDEKISMTVECRFVRIRIIKYNNHIFYHKMINGELTDFKEI